MKPNFIKNKYLWIFLAVFALGIFLRAYNFTPWLHFELDQSRDANLISEAVEKGAGELPLLGPRAAGSFLRLGPAFYYIEYIFAKIFGDTPQGSALAVLFFSILSIPLFYVFIARYFNKKLSLGLTLLFSVSLFMVTYSRFAWNPNLIPFFALAVSYFLLKAVDKKEKRKNWYLLASAIFLGILIQFHFLALIIAPLAIAIFLIIKRPKIKFKFWLASILAIIILNVPMIVNEIKTGGDNAKQFMEVVAKKSTKEKHTLVEKALENYLEHSLNYWTIISGSQSGELFRVESVNGSNIKFDIKCDRSCRDNLLQGMLALLVFTAGLLSLAIKLAKERNIAKKDFLTFNAIYFAVAFIIFTPLAFKLSPRFFLVTAAIPFALLGLLLERFSYLAKDKNKTAIIIIAILAVLNLFFTYKFFEELRLAPSKNIEIGRDKILKQKTRITLEQQKQIVDYLESFYQKNNYPVFYKGQNEFHRAFAYLLDKRKIPRDGISKSKICRQGNYFLIIRAQSDIQYYRGKYENYFNFISKKEFGTLTVFKLTPKENSITKEAINPSELKRDEAENNKREKSRRYRWKEI